MNAMALIAPGAFLWLTFYAQATEGATSPAMWIGIFFALVAVPRHRRFLCGNGEALSRDRSSYYFAEQSFLNHDKAWRYARLSKFIVGWALAPVLLDLSRE